MNRRRFVPVVAALSLLAGLTLEGCEFDLWPRASQHGNCAPTRNDPSSGLNPLCPDIRDRCVPADPTTAAGVCVASR